MPNRLLSLAIAVALLSACALPPTGDRAAPQQYQLSLDEYPTPLAEPLAGILLIEQPRAAPGFDNRNIAYQVRDFEIQHYTRSRWADTPTRMLNGVLINVLESSGIAEVVTTPATNMPPDLRLVIDQLSLQQRFTDSDTSYTQLRMRVQLIDPNAQRVLGSQLINVRQPAPSANAAGGVRAANAALAEAVVEITQFTEALLRTR
ncbi:hypothetical protein CAI21_03450 [Alkalilimnicola ehrlichii]|uniref:ABC-type transport auxiliary lipoprotein component domain-containing protein n=1 Tax=Alkalilimnicola ehrlichii TaxID=351052 RepID=A0A3E0X0Q6_9GAMM|nr:ABC-type transport auxiliary lipoprotein family protein [Alkalilimnicola ehrlichii]RFA31039.1 hypothetical protein CAI21_03450 [Alkalilimnicola ehrlichii]RFA38992.1 hypothetical protein CAL65_03600 [Alkalilimnicola ehrlichii]